jgi:putative transposase
MSDYRRCDIPCGCYFFTVVTHARRPLFKGEDEVDLLRQAMRHVMSTRPFEIQAKVVLPDHLNAVWRLPDGDGDFSRRWRDIKHYVSKRMGNPIHQRCEKLVWQRRFWERAIRDEDDWRRHLDYVHYNPAKHGLASCAPWSGRSARFGGQW